MVPKRELVRTESVLMTIRFIRFNSPQHFRIYECVINARQYGPLTISHYAPDCEKWEFTEMRGGESRPTPEPARAYFLRLGYPGF
jgi:hypothetical protein